MLPAVCRVCTATGWASDHEMSHPSGGRLFCLTVQGVQHTCLTVFVIRSYLCPEATTHPAVLRRRGCSHRRLSCSCKLLSPRWRTISWSTIVFCRGLAHLRCAFPASRPFPLWLSSMLLGIPGPSLLRRGLAHRCWACRYYPLLRRRSPAQHAASGPVSHILRVFFGSDRQTCTHAYGRSAAREALPGTTSALRAHGATCTIRGHVLHALPSWCRADATARQGHRHQANGASAQGGSEQGDTRPRHQQAPSLTNTHAEEGSNSSAGYAVVGAARRKPDEQDQSTPHFAQSRQYAPKHTCSTSRSRSTRTAISW